MSSRPEAINERMQDPELPDLELDGSTRNGCKVAARRLLLSRGFSWFYIIIILVQLVLFGFAIDYLANGTRQETWYFVIDTLVMVMFLVEIMIRFVAAQAKKYCSSCCNVIDMACAFVATVFWIVEVATYDDRHEYMVFALMLRFGGRLFRMYVIARHFAQRASMTGEARADVDLQSLQAADRDRQKEAAAAEDAAEALAIAAEAVQVGGTEQNDDEGGGASGGSSSSSSSRAKNKAADGAAGASASSSSSSSRLTAAAAAPGSGSGTSGARRGSSDAGGGLGAPSSSNNNNSASSGAAAASLLAAPGPGPGLDGGVGGLGSVSRSNSFGSAGPGRGGGGGGSQVHTDEDEEEGGGAGWADEDFPSISKNSRLKPIDSELTIGRSNGTKFRADVQDVLKARAQALKGGHGGKPAGAGAGAGAGASSGFGFAGAGRGGTARPPLEIRPSLKDVRFDAEETPAAVAK